MGILSKIGGFLFGSGPKIKSKALPTLSPEQNDALTSLLQNLQDPNQQPELTPFEGEFAAPLSNLEETSLAGLEQQAVQRLEGTGAQEAVTNLTGIAGGDSGQFDAAAQAVPNTGAQFTGGFDALQNIIGAGPTDFEDFFETNVAVPERNRLFEDILPAITSGFVGQGGANQLFGGEVLEQRRLAANRAFENILGAKERFAFQTREAQAGRRSSASQFLAALGQSEQSDFLDRLLAGSEGARGRELEANLGVAGVEGQDIQNTLSLLAGGAVPRSVEQAGLLGELEEFRRVQEGNVSLDTNRVNELLAAIGLPTIENLGFVKKGTEGAITGPLKAGVSALTTLGLGKLGVSV